MIKRCEFDEDYRQSGEGPTSRPSPLQRTEKDLEQERDNYVYNWLNVHGYENDPLFTPHLKLLVKNKPNGWLSVAYGIIRSGQSGEGLREVYDKFKSKIKNVIYGIDDYNPTSQRTLRNYGDYVIKSIRLGRYPIEAQSLLEKSLKIGNIFDRNTWNQSGQEMLNKIGYDKLFHLYSVITLEGAKEEIIYEKQSQVRIEPNYLNSNVNKAYIAKLRGHFEELDVPLGGKKITLNEFNQKARDKMGDEKYFKYNSFDDNCQAFLSQALQANGLQTNATKAFIYQNLKKLVEQLPWWAKLVSDISTEAEARLSPQVGGGDDDDDDDDDVYVPVGPDDEDVVSVKFIHKKLNQFTTKEQVQKFLYRILEPREMWDVRAAYRLNTMPLRDAVDTIYKDLLAKGILDTDVFEILKPQKALHIPEVHRR